MSGLIISHILMSGAHTVDMIIHQWTEAVLRLMVRCKIRNSVQHQHHRHHHYLRY